MSTAYLLKRNLKIISTSVKNVAYNSLLRPSLEYACSVWDPYTQANVDKLEKVQRRAARFILNDDYNSSVSGMFTKLHWDSLQARSQTHRLANFNKIHYGLVNMGAEFRMCNKEHRGTLTPQRMRHRAHVRAITCTPFYQERYETGTCYLTPLSDPQPSNNLRTSFQPTYTMTKDTFFCYYLPLNFYL